ncbi:type 1 fimbrial protein [Salmonella enterica subsp. diarizonae]|nr:type 1 fimbrial protein [Salmonella enterica subsp. diarizonae]
MSLKTNLSLAAICLMASGVAAAATSVGNGTLTINGTINASTCTVVPSKTSLTVPNLVPTNIDAASNDAELYKDTVSFDFKDCGAAGNTMVMKLVRDVEAPDGAGGANALKKAGFNYSNGTQSQYSPLYYQLTPSSTSNFFMLDGTGNNIDISAIQDKGAFSIPVDLIVKKAANVGIDSGRYVGSFTAAPTWSVEYP